MQCARAGANRYTCSRQARTAGCSRGSICPRARAVGILLYVCGWVGGEYISARLHLSEWQSRPSTLLHAPVSPASGRKRTGLLLMFSIVICGYFSERHIVTDKSDRYLLLLFHNFRQCFVTCRRILYGCILLSRVNNKMLIIFWAVGNFATNVHIELMRKSHFCFV